MKLKNVAIFNDEGSALHIFNSHNVNVDDFGYHEEVAVPVRVQGTQNEKLVFSTLTGGDEAINFVEGATPAAVQRR